MSNRAWVTLATNDSYGLGALVLAHSLRRAGTAYPSIVLITPSVTDAMRERLRAVFAEVVTVDVLDSRDAAHLALLQRPELGITFTKIHCWNLTQYEKCVFLDADILVVQNCDELFEREELSAAPDVGWPDCFNSGVFVFKPSSETFNQLIAFAQERGSFDGGDQGLLNSFFSDWARGDINKHLPFLYNVTSAAFYSYLPALKHYGQNLKVIHFIGAAKPWLQHFNWESSTVDAPEHLREFLQLWWDLFVAQVHSQLDISMVEVEEAPSVLPPDQPPHDVSPHHHYQPVLDPESEFPWHHPDAQRQEEYLEKRIDFTDIHDPWELYRGHIPPRSDEKSTCDSVFERNEDQEEIRQYAWEYQFQNIYQSNENDMGSHEQLQQFEHSNDNYQRHNYDESNFHEYNEPPHYQHNHEYQSCQHYYEPKSLQEHHESQINHHHYPPQSYEQHYDEHIHTCDHSNQHFSHEYQYQSNQTYGQYEHSIDDVPWEHRQYETQHELKDSNEQNFQKHFESTVPNTACFYQNHYNTAFDKVYTLNANNHDQYKLQEHSHQQHYTENSNENQNEHFENFEQHYSHNCDPISDQLIHITEKNQNNKYFDTISEPQSSCQLKSNNIQAFSAQVQQKKKRNRSNRIHRIDFAMSPPNMNGDLSDTDSDISEDIIPRHPYDGFYLRHRAIIDSYGRKICSHEIPPAPPQSPSPPLPQEVLELVNIERGQDLSSSDSGNQSGVAGNLARVVPGSGSQGEALDELTRRQGWEAGNIDYMGADSFANIWAKISQTLSQPRKSPSKSPPKEPTPSQTAPIEVKSAATELLEIAKEATETPPQIEASTPTEIPAQVEVPTPLKTTLLTETVKPVEAPATAKAVTAEETVATVKAAAPIDTSAPVEVVTPVETASSDTVVAPIDTAKPDITSASDEISAPVEISVPVEIAAPVEISAPIETSAPVETSAPLETAASVKTSVLGDIVPSVKAAAPIKITDAVESTASVEIPISTEVPVEAATEPVSTLVEAAVKDSTDEVVSDVPLTVEAPVSPVTKLVESSPAAISTSAGVPVTVEGAEKVQTPKVDATVPVPVEVSQKTECVAPIKSTPFALETPEAPGAVAPSDIPVPVETAAEVPVPVETALETEKTESAETLALQSEAIASKPIDKSAMPVVPVEVCPKSPAVAAEAAALETTPSKAQPAPASDSPPLAHTPSKEEAPAVPAAKSEERRKPAGKLQLSPPAIPDPLPTPDSEVEDAAALAHSIITSELQAAAAPSPPTPLDRLAVEETEVPTPPVGAVSLAQIGVKPAKGKPTTAAQIESSVAEKEDAPTPAPAAEGPKAATKEAPKKKVVKKVVKKDSGASGAGGDAPVPPPRKKEKKPKEK